jgi:hypothetical protein
VGVWQIGHDEGQVVVWFDDGSRVSAAEIHLEGQSGPGSNIPRPSLFEHVRTWLGKRGE